MLRNKHVFLWSVLLINYYYDAVIILVPCTRELAESRDKQSNQALQLVSRGEIVESTSSVLTEFSSVVTDTQEYMSPHHSNHDDTAAAAATVISAVADTDSGGNEVNEDLYPLNCSIQLHAYEKTVGWIGFLGSECILTISWKRARNWA